MDVPRLKVTYIDRYNFVSRTGDKVSGCKVSYVSDSKVSDRDSRGIPVYQITGSYELYEKFQDVPGLYELEIVMKPDSKGRPTQSLEDVKFFSPSVPNQ